jgi:hypothetical protein
MFDNTLDLDGPIPAMSLIDTNEGESTRRVNLGGGDSHELHVRRQETAENKGIITDRYQVRVDSIFTDSITAKPIRGSASLVLAYPRHTRFGNPEMQTLSRAAIAFFTGGLPPEYVTTLNAQLLRIFNGEL